jgi:hypothetical protein
MTGISGGVRTGVSEVYNTLHCDRLVESSGVFQLATDTFQIFQVIIQNDPDSASSVTVGNSHKQFFEIEPGGALTVPVDSLAKVYVAFSGAATVNWLAMG